MKKLLSIIIFVVVIQSCVEVEPVSPVPEIKYKSFDIDYIYNEELDQTIQTRVLEFDFIDGDADLGVYDDVNTNLSLPIEARFGIFIHFFEKIDTNYIERFFITETPGVVEKDSSWTEKIDKQITVIDSTFVDSVWVEEERDTIIKADTTYFKQYFKDTLIIDTNFLHQLLPHDQKMDRVGQNKIVKGTMRVGVLFPAELPYDSMRLEFYIRDRALHKSNVEVTDDFGNDSIGMFLGI